MALNPHYGNRIHVSDVVCPTLGAFPPSTLDHTIAAIGTALNAKLAASVLDLDGTLAANSDTRVPSQKAIVTFVNAISGGVSGVRMTIGTTAPASPVNNKDIWFDTTGGSLLIKVYSGSAWIANRTTYN